MILVNTLAVSLAPALTDHLSFFIALRNHPQSRQALSGLSTGTLGDEAWFRQALLNTAYRLWVSHEAHEPAALACLNLSCRPREALLHVAVRWDRQGHGLGTAMIDAVAEEAMGLGLATLVAPLIDTDTGSRIAFGRAAFVIESIEDGIVTMSRRLCGSS